MRFLTLALLPAALALSASVPAQPANEPLDTALQRARAELAVAERESARLDQTAGRARNQVERLQAEEQAAAQGIETAEARITAADAQLRLADAYVAAHRERLAQEQRPASALLAGLAVMARRPPLLALANRGSTDDLVAVRILLADTLPVIRARTAAISGQLAEGQKLQQAALSARSELRRSQQALVERRSRFAVLEQQAQQQALASSGQALTAGDTVLAAGEDLERLRGNQSDTQGIRNIARQFAATEPAPPRPVSGEGSATAAPFAYLLPANAPVTEGLAAVSASGVRARGLTLATPRGAALTAPAQGTVRFSGPFRDYDGVLIIDHGGGWMTLIVNLSSPLKAGDRVQIGDPIGRALGPIQLELSRNGQRISPALIAGSSAPLSKGAKGG